MNIQFRTSRPFPKAPNNPPKIKKLETVRWRFWLVEESKNLLPDDVEAPKFKFKHCEFPFMNYLSKGNSEFCKNHLFVFRGFQSVYF